MDQRHGVTPGRRPGLESAQDSITSYIDLTGQVVMLVWLVLTFGWILLLASIARVGSGTLLFLLGFGP